MFVVSNKPILQSISVHQDPSGPRICSFSQIRTQMFHSKFCKKSLFQQYLMERNMEFIQIFRSRIAYHFFYFSNIEVDFLQNALEQWSRRHCLRATSVSSTRRRILFTSINRKIPCVSIDSGQLVYLYATFVRFSRNVLFERKSSFPWHHCLVDRNSRARDVN